MNEIISNLSWWQMPLSGLGTRMLDLISSTMSFALVLGIFCYLIYRL